MKKMSLLVLSMAIALSAAFVPVDRAKTVAENQYKQYCADASTKSASINVVEHRYEGEITWYMFEFEKGFVIVSADDAVRAILGYSDHGKVPSNDRVGGENFKEWFGYYDKQIAIARKTGYVDKIAQQNWKDIENNVFSSSKAGIIVDRLLKTQYDQVYPWNDDCPWKIVSGDSTWTYVGCVATSMAQLLRYHRWPDVGVGSASYSWNNGTTNITLAANFTTHTWNYDLMPEVVDIEYGLYPYYWESGITQAEVDELALQSYWVGLSVNMQYGDTADGGSGAYTTDSDNAFIDHWKGTSTYASMATPAAPPTADALYTTIKTQLDAKRPWQWSGGVHSFNLDGYRDDYWYHFNWGWAGYCDGWYHRSALIPSDTGSGGGDGDYTSGQAGITYTPTTNPFTAWPATTLSGSVTGDDISLTWTAQTGATGYDIYKTTEGTQNPVFVTTVTGTSYASNNTPAGVYYYHIVTKYAAGESHNSNVYTATVAVDPLFPVPMGATATAVGRTNIDVAWIAPFVGVLNAFISFDPDGAIPSDWRQENTSDTSVGVSVWQGQTDDTIFTVHEDQYSGVWHDGPLLIGRGYFMIIMTTTAMNANGIGPHTRWFMSPTITFNSSHTIKWWNRFRYTDDAGVPIASRPLFQIATYAGTFSETRRESGIVYTILATYDGSNGAPENIWAYEESVAIPAGTTRVAIRVPVDTSDLYSLSFDNITVGSPVGGGDAPNGYQVYRNGSLATTITSGTTYEWEDTGFADGDNTYNIIATYPTGSSITSNYATAYMDANPKPDFLTGTVAPSTQANLSWYMPYHNPPKWYAYIQPEDCTSTIDYLDPDACPRRRTLFKAEDLGFYYPITLDSVAIAFYDWAEGNWDGNNTFTIRILTGGTSAMTDTVYTSSVCTAVHNQIYYHKLTTPMVLSEPWNVEITTNSTGYPGTLAGLSTTGSTHSYFYYTVALSYMYGMTGGGLWYEWAHMSHVTSSAPPPIAKSGWVAPLADLPVKGIEAVRKDIVKAPVTNPKALDYYKIYRDGVSIGTSTSLSYADSSVPATADYTYKVSAYYADPVGESDFSNEIVLNVEGSGGPVIPAVPTPVTSTVVAGNVRFDWPDMADATSYDVYSSATPYGTFALLTNVTVSEYTYTPTATKMFFQFVSKNSTKESPKTIEVKRSMTK